MALTTYQEDRYPLPVIRGKVEIGESVSVRDCMYNFCGQVVYIHPKRRYLVVENDSGIRESFLLRVPTNGEKVGVNLEYDMWLEDGEVHHRGRQRHGSRAKKYDLFGESVSVPQVADRLGVQEERIRQRLRRGWDMEKIVLRLQYLDDRDEKTESWQMDFSARWNAMRREIFGIV